MTGHVWSHAIQPRTGAGAKRHHQQTKIARATSVTVPTCASPSRTPFGCAPTSQFQRQKYVFIHINGDKTKPMIRMKHNSKMDEAVEVIGCVRSIVEVHG